MNRFIRQSVPALVASAALLLSLGACTAPTAAPSPSVSENTPPPATVASTGAADHIFTVRYNANKTLNPITGSDPNNMALAPLLYEGLFVLNNKLEAEKVLCDTFTTTDGLTYTIKLKSGIAMSDGSTLTATDVRYTYTQARQAGRFAGRLKIIDSITAVDSLTVKITLKYANLTFPKLLDVPVIKANSIDQNHPAGAGPYYFASSESPSLIALPGYRLGLPVQVIHLKDETDTQLSMDFSSQQVDFFWDDPADSSEIIIHSDHETRYYNTTVLEYVGFNAKKTILANPDLRRALGLAIDRSKIIGTVYSNHAVSAPLILNPNFAPYDPKWLPNATDNLSEISEIFSTIGSDPEGLRDEDNDGYLEMRDQSGKWINVSLTIIVNSDNQYKVQVARLISDALRSVGIDITLRTLPWSDYMTDLQKGTFDLYLGDVSLPADNDLTALLAPGGSLDYGKVGNANYVARINAFLSASSEAARKDAAKDLCDFVYLNAPLVPILYRQYAVHSNRNIILGLNPTQSSLFYGFSGWKVNLS